MCGKYYKKQIKETIHKDIHGWVNASNHKPPKELHFEILMLKDEKEKTQQGWWTGSYWDYHPVKISGNVLKWRRLKNEERSD